MKPCPDCQCKNPDTATTCKWCARDVSAVPVVPDVSAVSKPAYVAEGRRLDPCLTNNKKAPVTSRSFVLSGRI